MAGQRSKKRKRNEHREEDRVRGAQNFGQSKSAQRGDRTVDHRSASSSAESMRNNAAGNNTKGRDKEEPRESSVGDFDAAGRSDGHIAESMRGSAAGTNTNDLGQNEHHNSYTSGRKRGRTTSQSADHSAESKRKSFVENNFNYVVGDGTEHVDRNSGSTSRGDGSRGYANGGGGNDIDGRDKKEHHCGSPAALNVTTATAAAQIQAAEAETARPEAAQTKAAGSCAAINTKHDKPRLTEHEIGRAAIIRSSLPPEDHTWVAGPTERVQLGKVFSNEAWKYLEPGDVFQTAPQPGHPDTSLHKLRYHLFLGYSHGKLICFMGTTRGGRGMERRSGYVYYGHESRQDDIPQEFGRWHPWLLERGNPAPKAMFEVIKPNIVREGEFIRLLDYAWTPEYANHPLRLAHRLNTFAMVDDEIDRLDREEREEKKYRQFREKEAWRYQQYNVRVNAEARAHFKQEVGDRYQELDGASPSVPSFSWLLTPSDGSLEPPRKRQRIDGNFEPHETIEPGETPSRGARSIPSPTQKAEPKHGLLEVSPLKLPGGTPANNTATTCAKVREDGGEEEEQESFMEDLPLPSAPSPALISVDADRAMGLTTLGEHLGKNKITQTPDSH